MLRPRWSSASSNELRMSLPMAAVGPLNVLTNPIFTDLFWANAGPAATAIAPTTSNAHFIMCSPRCSWLMLVCLSRKRKLHVALRRWQVVNVEFAVVGLVRGRRNFGADFLLRAARISPNNNDLGSRLATPDIEGAERQHFAEVIAV